MDEDQYQTLLDERNTDTPDGLWSGQPAIQATTVVTTNTSDRPMWVEVGANGATMTGVKIDGVTIGTPVRTSGAFIVRPGSTIALLYSAGAPVWQWFELP